MRVAPIPARVVPHWCDECDELYVAPWDAEMQTCLCPRVPVSRALGRWVDFLLLGRDE
ncbi:MAG: hypothetical protein QNK04_03345 [Myxococcota bacterium]|nr:hypothetical protein [Myxococcota bacterium]